MGYISKIRVGGSDYAIGTSLFGTCNTAAGTANKTVTLSDFSALTDGIHISVYFQNENNLSGQTATLNVNSTGAKPIYLYGTTRPTANELSWKAGAVVDFVYHNNAWYLVDNLKTASDLGAIADPSTKTSGQFLKYDGTAWVADALPGGASPSDATPGMDSGTGSAGTSDAYSRGDHVHPTDTSRQATITANGLLKGNGSGTVTAATAGTDYQAPITFDGTYSSTNKAATVSTVTNAINALDGGTIGTGSTTKTITSLSQTNGNVSATFSDIAFPVTSVNGQTGAVTTAEKFVITATAISGTNYYNLDKTFADINVAIGDNKYVTIEDIDMTYPYTTTVSQGVVFGATLIATGEGNQLMAVTDGILVVPPDSGTNAMGIAVHSSIALPTMSDIPSASSTTPLMDGTADVGIQTYIYARADHVHPTDTSRQAVLVSGTNIKTINNESILGSGNISIGSDVFIATYDTTTYNEIQTALNAGKLVFVPRGTGAYVYAGEDTEVISGTEYDYYVFTSAHVDGGQLIEARVRNDNVWSSDDIYVVGDTSPQFYGTPTAPTAAAGTNTTQLATTAFVQSAVSSSDTLIATVTFTGTQYAESYSCDTTYDSLYSALSSGRDVILRYKDTSSDNNLYNFFLSEGFNTIHSGDTLYFSRVTDNGEIHRFSVTNTDYWAYSSYKIASTKVDALDSTSKLYLVGAKNQQSSVTSYSNSDVYATNGVLNAKSFSVDASANIVYNSSAKSIDFTFV